MPWKTLLCAVFFHWIWECIFDLLTASEVFSSLGHSISFPIVCIFFPRFMNIESRVAKFFRMSCTVVTIFLCRKSLHFISIQSIYLKMKRHSNAMWCDGKRNWLKGLMRWIKYHIGCCHCWLLPVNQQINFNFAMRSKNQTECFLTVFFALSLFFLIKSRKYKWSSSHLIYNAIYSWYRYTQWTIWLLNQSKFFSSSLCPLNSADFSLCFFLFFTMNISLNPFRIPNN